MCTNTVKPLMWEDGYAVNNKGKVVYLSIDCPVCNNIIKTQDREASKLAFPTCPFCGTDLSGGVEHG